MTPLVHLAYGDITISNPVLVEELCDADARGRVFAEASSFSQDFVRSIEIVHEDVSVDMPVMFVPNVKRTTNYLEALLHPWSSGLAANQLQQLKEDRIAFVQGC